MKLNRNFFSKVYRILFWYSPNMELPNSLCPLFWNIVFGIMFFFFISPIILVENTISYIVDFLSLNKRETYVSNLNEKFSDKLDSIDNVFSDKFGIWGKLILVTLITLFFYIIALFFHSLNKYSDNTFTLTLKYLFLICFIISAFAFITLVLLYIVTFIFKVIIYLLNTDIGVKVSNPINNFLEKSFDKVSWLYNFIMEKYCPKIDWSEKDNK